MTKKAYILDTNVILHDPGCFFNFEDNDIYLPIYVLEELDKMKGESSLRGRNAREACRILDGMRGLGNSLSEGVGVSGGILRVYVPKERRVIESGLDRGSFDSMILQVAIELRELLEIRVILVTMDVNLRVRGDSLGVIARGYESGSVDVGKIEGGIYEIEGEIDEIYAERGMRLIGEYEENSLIMIREGIRTGLGRYYGGYVYGIKEAEAMGISAKNREQRYALDLLLDDRVPLVSLVGIAGSGKTLLASAVGLSKVLEGKYSKMIVTRPVVPMGRDIGYLPGSMDEKLDPWMQPIYDNLELLLMMGGKRKKGLVMKSIEDLRKHNLLKVEAMTYMRGRSIPKQFIIMDECQNATLHEIKTMITRCGEGTKIVITGDLEQIDNPYLDASTSGLAICIEKLRGSRLFGHVSLPRGERSELANLAAEAL
jgi:PhoH-like ATPase